MTAPASTLFTRLIRGEIPCEKILENENYFSFLDIRPINLGHVLVIPKIETDELFEVEDFLLEGILVFAKRIAKAQKLALSCRRIGVLIAGFEVPHAHIHLVPLQAESELTFSRAKPAPPEDLKITAAQIRAHL